MEKARLENAIVWLEQLLEDFKKAKIRGKETNSNKERAQSISDIEGITQKLETYIRHNEDLLEEITGKEIELARNIKWSDIVRPSHFEEDLRKEIDNLKQKTS